MKKLNSKELVRCPWPKDDLLMIDYHDKEWGVPVHRDEKIFQFLVLEGMQAGLSWSTILHKRENFRRAFDNFDVEKVARYDGRKIRSLLSDKGIIRNRLKIEAAVNNARQFIKVMEDFGSFDKYVWRFVDGKPIVNVWKTLKGLPASTKESDAMSKDLKERGFKFVGTTICYAHMQATGMVNDHVTSCFRYRELK
ncbi:MAG: DNA-3-methyladenine glycosylase I [Bacteroidetes bacterium]|nr:DNA-3-methyladenine glycosylase I [Bacteroidota bacterium]